MSRQRNIDTGFNPRLVPFESTTANNFKVDTFSVIKKLFIGCNNVLDDRVAEGLLANMLRWHGQLSTNREDYLINNFLVFRKIFDLNDEVGVHKSEEIIFSGHIHNEHHKMVLCIVMKHRATESKNM